MLRAAGANLRTGAFRTPNTFPSSTVLRSFSSSSIVAKDLELDKLVLQDGTVFKGKSFGADKPVSGELVFNTGMVGYPENLTDPSYKGQILVLTYPLQGNYGVPPKSRDKFGLLKYLESDRIHVSGLVVANYSKQYSHWNAVRSLGDWLKDEGIPAIDGVDTRSITTKIRSEGVTIARFEGEGLSNVEFSDPNTRNLSAEVSIKSPTTYGNGDVKIIAVDCGMKNNIVRNMAERGATVKVVPWDYDYTNEDYDGLFISNGPGDPSHPEILEKTVSHIQTAINEIGKPIFGICFGNQLVAKAIGAKTYKLPFGNRGQNQACIDQLDGMCYITPQNHGYAVDMDTLPDNWEPSFINATDGSNEGIICTNKPYFTIQFHPEARGGPYDTQFLFDKFLNKIREGGNTFYQEPVRPAKRSKAKKVLVIGSGGLQIGQAGEFDYSGSQAIKALKEEGVSSVLVNPNIATIQTYPGLADSVYFLPTTAHFLEEVMKKEKPNGVLLGFGGQTGLNIGVELYKNGTFKKHGVEVLGTQVQSIINTEDRDLFAEKLAEIDVDIAESKAVDNIPDAVTTASKIGYPVMVRAAYALGGLGSGFAKDESSLKALVRKALASSPQVLVEKSLKGWKEVEYEVVRDIRGNAITVCNMENFDPMGIHTGESIVIAPSQTLTSDEYHKLRSIAIKTVSHLGIVGECNIQYTLDPYSEDYRVIEVNARLSRSSALASKATGYPLAFVAAKLSLGLELPDLRNAVTKDTTANFEPALDYVVVKMPRWDIVKFTEVDPHIGSMMKSVGEVMAVGRSFEEGMQKAIRMVDTANSGFAPKKWMNASDEELEDELRSPTPERIFALSAAIKRGWSQAKVHEMTRIDTWFLSKLYNINSIENRLAACGDIGSVPRDLLEEAKRAGFSDDQIAKLYGYKDDVAVREHRKAAGILPVVKKIDTLAAEFPAKTNYLYMTYNGTENDLPKDEDSIVVLGSGVYRIGSSVEFDYCSVCAVRSFNALGEKTVMINYNPETVSTDYDESGKLYFEELSFERVADILDHEGAKGVVVSVGGQQPNNIALKLDKQGYPIMGTPADSIDNAEDRYRFSSTLDSLGVDQPEWKELSNMDEALSFADTVGFPVLVRPSYVLSGAAMGVVDNKNDLEAFLGAASDVSPDHPVVITKFVKGAKELECDAIAQEGRLVNWAIAEHIENAGVHSGDATHILPTYTIPDHIKDLVKNTSEKIATALKVSGPVNIQYLYKDDQIKVIECNLRASRSIPFVSKVLGVDFISTAAKIWLSPEEKLEPNQKCIDEVSHYGVKSPQFSFQRLLGADPRLGVEMASTGEVACFGETPNEAFMKSLLAANFAWPEKKKVLLSNVGEDFVPSAKKLIGEGFQLFATPETAEILNKAGIDNTQLSFDYDAQDSAFEHIMDRKVDFLVNFPEPRISEDRKYYELRRKAVDFRVNLVNDRKIADMIADALTEIKTLNDIKPLKHLEYVEPY